MKVLHNGFFSSKMTVGVRTTYSNIEKSLQFAVTALWCVFFGSQIAITFLNEIDLL